MTHPGARGGELYRLERGGAPHVLLEEHLALIARLRIELATLVRPHSRGERRHHGSTGPTQARLDLLSPSIESWISPGERE
jgi:hypothetical protein